MIRRFTRIKREFGTVTFVRTVLLLFGLVGMSALGVFAFGSIWPPIASISGLALGWLLRRQIVEVFEWVSWGLPAAFFIYGILLFVGERFGLTREAQLIIMTITTVLVFDLQFWSLSDRSIVRIDDDR